MTITNDFIKDNLPTADLQLDIFKNQLSIYSNYKFDFTFHLNVHYIQLANSLYLDQIDRQHYFYLNDHEFLKLKVIQMFDSLSESIVKYCDENYLDKLGILSIHDMIDKTYLYSIYNSNRIQLLGIVSIF